MERASIAKPVRVAVVNDYELIVDGVAAMLSRFPDRLTVCDRIIIGEPLVDDIDVALYDTYGRVGIAKPALLELSATPQVDKVVVFSFDLHPELLKEAREAGVHGAISKAVPAETIADAIVEVSLGKDVYFNGERVGVPTLADPSLTWPGSTDGLTERESQVLVLVAEGLSNREIAEALHLSSETVKSYLRDVFMKMGFKNRVQATKYVLRSGVFRRYGSTDPLGAFEQAGI